MNISTGAAQRAAGLWSYALLAAGLLAFYIAILPPDITFEDTPLFAAVCYSLGLPHEPGYPAYVLSCYPFARAAAWLGASPAFGAAIYSALCTAIACAVMAYVANRMLAPDGWAGHAAGGLLGLVPMVVNQTQIPEVYALNMLLLALSFLLALLYAEQGSRRLLPGLALLAGLGLAVHWPLFMLVYPAVLLLLAPHWRRVLTDLRSLRLLVACVLALLLGLAPYLHLLLVDPTAFVFSTTGETLPNGFWAYVARTSYGIDGENLSWALKSQNLLILLRDFAQPFGYAFGLLLLPGCVLFARSCGGWRMAALLWGVLSTTVLLYLARPFDLELALTRWVFSAYPLPAYLFASLALAAVFAWLGRRLARPRRERALAALLLPLCVATASWRGFDRSDEDYAIRYAELFLADARPDDVVYMHVNDFFFAIRYLRHLRGIEHRPDIRVEEWENFQDHLDDIAAEPARSFTNDYVQMQDSAARYDGARYEILKQGEPGSVQVDLTPAAREFIADVTAGYERGHRNIFTQLFLADTIKKATAHMVDAQLAGTELAAADQRLLTDMLTTPIGRFSRFVTYISKHSVSPAEAEREFLAVAPYLEQLLPQQQAEAMHVLATARALRGDLAGARELLERALEAFPSSSNLLVLTDLLQIMGHQGEFEAFRDLRHRYRDFDTPAIAEFEERCREALQTPSCVPS